MRALVLILPALMLLFPHPLEAVETRVVVRVRAHDAKFIGTGMGGVQVSLRKADTGELLASGTIAGGTGSTKTLIEEPISRTTRLADEGSSRFEARLDLAEPTRIEVEVAGPLGGGANLQRSSQTLWVLPGRHIDGDGLLLTLRGFVVHPLSPAPHQVFKAGEAVPLEAHVVLMCGCPVEPGGLWNAGGYAVEALVQDGARTVARVPLAYAGEVNRFRGSFIPPAPGSYRVLITAADDGAHNYGVGISGLVVK